MCLTVFQQIVADKTHVLRYVLPSKRDIQPTGQLRSTKTYPHSLRKDSHFKNSFSKAARRMLEGLYVLFVNFLDIGPAASETVQRRAVMGRCQSRLGFKSRFEPFWRFDLRCLPLEDLRFEEKIGFKIG